MLLENLLSTKAELFSLDILNFCLLGVILTKINYSTKSKDMLREKYFDIY